MSVILPHLVWPHLNWPHFIWFEYAVSLWLVVATTANCVASRRLTQFAPWLRPIAAHRSVQIDWLTELKSSVPLDFSLQPISRAYYSAQTKWGHCWHEVRWDEMRWVIWTLPERDWRAAALLCDVQPNNTELVNYGRLVMDGELKVKCNTENSPKTRYVLTCCSVKTQTIQWRAQKWVKGDRPLNLWHNFFWIFSRNLW